MLTVSQSIEDEIASKLEPEFEEITHKSSTNFSHDDETHTVKLENHSQATGELRTSEI